jgi:hypothetical protein
MLGPIPRRESRPGGPGEPAQASQSCLGSGLEHLALGVSYVYEPDSSPGISTGGGGASPGDSCYAPRWRFAETDA